MCYIFCIIGKQCPLGCGLVPINSTEFYGILNSHLKKFFNLIGNTITLVIILDIRKTSIFLIYFCFVYLAGEAKNYIQKVKMCINLHKICSIESLILSPTV